MRAPMTCDRTPAAPSYSRSRVRSLLSALTLLSLSVIACGCTSGLMTMPGAALMSNAFARDADKVEKSEKKDVDKKSAKKSGKDDEEDNDFGNKIDTPLLSEYMSVQGNSLVVLRGVGLVTGLDGTGGDPSPSALRTQLQNEMSRRGVKQAKQILASPNTALVVVTAYLPPMVRKGQRFDIRVALPPNSNAKSLKGGWLLETRLFEEQNIEGHSALKAQEYAVGGGAILTSLGVRESRDEKQATLMTGTIPGGAVSKVDRDLSIVLRTEKRSFRNATRIADAVSERFHKYNNFGQRIVCAEAKTDAQIQLKTHDQYLNNFPRYQGVIRNIAFNESDVARRIRMEQLAREILDPQKCQAAALQLEAIGDDAILFLKDALDSEDFEVRFQAAQSLAYLGDATGVSVLAEAARTQPAFRVYSLVALSVIDDADAVIALRDLMNSPEIETCYGAFRALKECDPLDPSLNPVEFKGRFTMHVIDSTGEPKVHVTRRRAPEVVVFGARQGLILPAILNAGRSIRVKGDPGDATVEIIRYAVNKESERQRVPNELVSILRTCGELGATYPDIVQLLIEAEQQRNFAGQFGIDRLPQAGRLYLTEADAADDESQPSTASDERVGDDGKRIGTARQIPELFDELDEEELREHESEDRLMNLDFKEVSERDARNGSSLDTSEKDTADGNSAESDKDAEPESISKPAEVTKSAELSQTDEPADRNQDSDTTPSSEPETENDTAEPDDSIEPSTEKPKGRFGMRWWNKVGKPFGGLEEPTVE